jgi:hypothetical protein
LNSGQESSTQTTPVVTTAATATSKEQREVLLQTAFTNVRSSNGSKEIKARILLDSGSQRSCITNSLKSKLNLTPVKTETLNLNTFGEKRFTKQKCDQVEVSLKGGNGYHSISDSCFPLICSPLSTTIDISQYPHLKDLELADCSVLDGHDTNSDIDILIGCDYYYDFISGEIACGDVGPVAVESEFGWLISGPKTCSKDFAGVSVTNLIIEKPYPFPNPEILVDSGSHDKLTNIVQRFWETETIGVEGKAKSCQTDFLCETRFKAEVGRYEIKLPWKQEKPPTSTGYDMSVKRLRQLQSRLKKDKTLFQDYDRIIREQEHDGIVEQTSKKKMTVTSFHIIELSDRTKRQRSYE